MAEEKLLDRLLRPRVVFGTLAVVVVLAALLLPDDGSDEASGTLSSQSFDRSGLSAWYDGSARLGWKVKRREERFHGTIADSAVYVVVDPDVPPTAGEVGTLLAAVRNGAGLVVSSQRHSALADSLHVYSDDWQYGGYPVVGGSIPLPRAVEEGRETLVAPDSAARDTTAAADTAAARDTSPLPGKEFIEETMDEADDSVSASADTVSIESIRDKAARGRARSDSMVAAARRRRQLPGVLRDYSFHVRAALTATRPLPADTTAFLSVVAMSRFTPSVKPAVLGMPLGRGRVVVLGDPGILRNGLLDEQHLVVLPQRLLEWAAPAPNVPVIFDEYHHGLGRHGSMMRAVRNAFLETSVGRAGLQAIAAGLVLLLALGARPIAPRPRMRLERRSPLEHVGALARAYMQKGATRLAARRLVHGLRRRHGAAARSGDDEAFLRRLAERYPALRPNVERLVAATQQPTSPRDFTLLADDIDTIERTLRT